MLFSRLIVLSFAASASAFSVQQSTVTPKTALYASNDNEGALDRRQVLASLGLTTAALGVSSAFAVSGSDVKDAARDAADTIKSKTNMGGGMNMGMGGNMGGGMGMNNPVEKAKDALGMNNMGSGMNMDKNMGMGGMGMNNPVEKAKDALGMGNMGGGMNMDKNVGMGNLQGLGMNKPLGQQAKDATKDTAKDNFSFPNPFGGNAGRKADELASTAKEGGRNVARKGKEIAENASNNASGNMGGSNMNPMNNMNNPMKNMNNPMNNMNKDNNPMTNKNPMSSNNMNMPNMPNSPGDAGNKLKDAVSGGPFSTAMNN